MNNDVRVLRVALLQSGRTLHEVARAIGTSKSTLSNIANGLYEPTDALRERISAEFPHIPASRLFAKLSDAMPWLGQAQ
jgi:transcriptional regulator with XRE-family HTH domain